MHELRSAAVTGFAPDDVLAMTPTRSVTAAFLASLHKRTLPKLDRQPVALQVRDPLVFLEALFAIHGRASRITILSPDLPDDHVDALCRQAGVSALVRDRADFIGDDSRGGEDVATAWQLTTSGTTGLPKLVTHGFASLSRAAKPRRADMPQPRWGLLYEPSRFAGLQVVIQSLIGGGLLLLTDSRDDLRSRVEFLADNGCTHLSATPSLWRKILMLPAAKSLTLRQVTLGGEIADQRLLSALRAFFPDARITHIYASTEVGVGFAVNDGIAGFPKAFLETPQQGADLKVHDGKLWVRSAGHGPRPAGRHIVVDDDGFACTDDLVDISGDRVTFGGRDGAVVNVGGTKIQIEPLEQKLRSHPLVAECILQDRPNPITGSLLILTVVPSDPLTDPKQLRQELKTWCKEHFERAAVPAKIEIVDEISLASSGKVRRTR